MPGQRHRVQQSNRKGYVKAVVNHLRKRLNTEEHLKRMCATNRILPIGPRSRVYTKKLFDGWICTLGKGRILTKKLAEGVCQKLRKIFSLTHGDHVEAENMRMHAFLKGSRKRRRGVLTQSQKSAMSSMDELTTIPYLHDWYGDDEGEEDRLLDEVFNLISIVAI